MKYIPTPLLGAYVIEIEPVQDERGFFTRSWCAGEFEEHGLEPALVQCNISYNHLKGILRGMHYQKVPHEEVKLVRCTMGSVFDVLIDLRKGSDTYTQWFGVELSAGNRRMLYIPKGFAHGFQTLEDDTEVFYQMSEVYHPECAKGVRWNDPSFSICWPEESSRILCARDRGWPDFQP